MNEFLGKPGKISWFVNTFVRKEFAGSALCLSIVVIVQSSYLSPALM